MLTLELPADPAAREAALDAFLEESDTWQEPKDQRPWQTWLTEQFPDVCWAPLTPRQTELWEWSEGLVPGEQSVPRVEIRARGSAKSTTAELICVRNAVTLNRRFVLYCAGTQDQADSHVTAIAAFMEQAGMERAIDRYGKSKGWSRQQVRTASGFNVAGYGLDVAVRGIKIEQYRPDLIIFDDIDSQFDSMEVVKKKIRAMTESIIPAGSSSCAVLIIQNLVHEEGIVSQLYKGRAEFLLEREVPEPEPAIDNLTYEGNSKEGFRITGGTATWQGQPREALERLLNKIGLHAFLRECQHNVLSDPKHRVFDPVYLQARKDWLERLEKLTPWSQAAQDAGIGCRPRRKYVCGQLGLSGDMEIFQEPLPGIRYIIGADVSEGITDKPTTDESTADVLRCDTLEQVATYWGKPDERAFAVDLWNISEWYASKSENRRAKSIPAQIAVENNSIGQMVIAYLEEYGANLWYNDPDHDSDTPNENLGAGFHTDKRTKFMCDLALQDAVVDAAAGRDGIVINSIGTIDQMLHYIRKRVGRGGEMSWHDDKVRSLAIAHFVAKGLYTGEPAPPREVQGNIYGREYTHRKI
jgi:hypothetical protein